MELYLNKNPDIFAVDEAFYHRMYIYVDVYLSILIPIVHADSLVCGVSKNRVWGESYSHFCKGF